MYTRPSNKIISRWLVLFSIIIYLFFTAVYELFELSTPVAEVTAGYHIYFMPAAYAGNIIFLINLTFIVYGIIQLLPSQRNYTIYDKLSLPFILLNVLACLWT